MNLPAELERIKVPHQDRQSLIALKRRTGIEHWNVLCRWAFCLSLSEEKPPKPVDMGPDSNIEMGWKTFGGEYSQLLFHLLVERCLADGLPLEQKNIVSQFRLHLHRGIGYLSTKGKINSVASLIALSKILPTPGTL